MKPLRPVTDLIRLYWLRWQRDNCNPLSPYMPTLVRAINRLENRR